MTNSTNQAQHASNPMPLTLLRASAVLATLGALAQAALGGSMITGGQSLLEVHSTIGMITMVLAIVAGVAAALWARRGGNTGMQWHALTVAVLALLQYMLGEMAGRPGMEIPHIVVGVVFLVAVIGLATLAFRKPYAASAHNPLNESTHGEHTA